MSNCKSCGTELNALNMSEIEPEWCNKCVKIKIEMIHPLMEDEEVFFILDRELNEMSRQLWPFPGTSEYPNKTNLADHHKPNPVDPRLDYIRKSLQDFEYEISVIKNTWTKDQLEEMSKEWRTMHGFSPFDNKED